MTEVTLRGHSGDVTQGVLLAHPQSRPSLRPVEVSSPAVRAEDRALDFRVLYETHVDFVWRNLRRLGVREADAEDRMQEVFVVAHRRFAEFEDRGHGPRAWLFQIVLRVASDARRHRRRHPEDPDGGHAMGRASIAPGQHEALVRQEQLSRLDAALDTIDVGRRAVLVLHENRGDDGSRDRSGAGDPAQHGVFAPSRGSRRARRGAGAPAAGGRAMSGQAFSTATKALLQAAKADGPSAAARAKVWSGVTSAIGGAAAGAGAVGGATAASASATAAAGATGAAASGIGAMKMLVIGTLLGGSITVGLATTMLQNRAVATRHAAGDHRACVRGGGCSGGPLGGGGHRPRGGERSARDARGRAGPGSRGSPRRRSRTVPAGGDDSLARRTARQDGRAEAHTRNPTPSPPLAPPTARATRWPARPRSSPRRAARSPAATRRRRCGSSARRVPYPPRSSCPRSSRSSVRRSACWAPPTRRAAWSRRFVPATQTRRSRGRDIASSSGKCTGAVHPVAKRTGQTQSHHGRARFRGRTTCVRRPPVQDANGEPI